MKIAIGIPAYNEEKNIGVIITKLKKISDTIIVCDDGSTDLTAEISRELGAEVITHSKNQGYGEAIKTIFLEAKKRQVDALVTFDADGQHQIQDIEKIIEPIVSGQADVVIGSRFLDDKTDIPKYRKIGVKVITELTNVTTGSKITDSQSGFRAYNKMVLENITPTESGMGISTEILIRVQEKGLKISGVKKMLNDGQSYSIDDPINLSVYKPSLKTTKVIKDRIKNISKIMISMRKNIMVMNSMISRCYEYPRK